LLIQALQKAEGKEKDELEYWLKNDRPGDEKQKIKAVTGIYNSLKIKELVIEKMNFYYDEALKCLEKVEVEKNRKNELINLANLLMERND
jgi:geranylgeranyl diphosphate synthase type II